MAWTTPRTWVTGETPTAAQFNAHIRDNLNFLYGAPSCRAYHNAAQAIVTATETGLAFNSERFDNDTMHSTATNTDRITANTAGRYLLISNGQFAANATGYRQWDIAISVGPAYVGMEILPVVSAAAATVMNVATYYAAAVTNYFYTSVIQTSGGNLNVDSSGNYSPEFMAHWMGN